LALRKNEEGLERISAFAVDVIFDLNIAVMAELDD
jgi:hypothetical protein